TIARRLAAHGAFLWLLRGADGGVAHRLGVIGEPQCPRVEAPYAVPAVQQVDIPAHRPDAPGRPVSPADDDQIPDRLRVVGTPPGHVDAGHDVTGQGRRGSAAEEGVQGLPAGHYAGRGHGGRAVLAEHSGDI